MYPIIQIILGVLKQSAILFIEMAPYLFLGMTVAGLMHIFVSKKMVAEHIGGNSLLAVIKAALFGVPLPLCSCGVVPTATYLKKHGASRPAVLSFLVSTPQTGVDSIIATYGMLGPVFAIFRPIAALLMGVLSGVIALFAVKESEDATSSIKNDDKNETVEKKDFKEKIKEMFQYAFVEFMDDIAIQFLVGLVIAGAISYLLPDNYFVGKAFAVGIPGMLLMMAVGIPMYVCATSSIPIALALIAKGFSPGAAYVFLVTGPATNAATIAILFRVLGKKTTSVYLGTIIGSGLVFGFLFDLLFPTASASIKEIAIGHAEHFAHAHGAEGNAFTLIIKYLSALLTLLLLFASLYRTKIAKYFRQAPSDGKRTSQNSCSCSSGSCDQTSEQKPNLQETSRTYDIEGMRCNHCVATVTDTLEALPFIENAKVSLENKKIEIFLKTATPSNELRKIDAEIERAILKIGYKITPGCN